MLRFEIGQELINVDILCKVS